MLLLGTNLRTQPTLRCYKCTHTQFFFFNLFGRSMNKRCIHRLRKIQNGTMKCFQERRPKLMPPEVPFLSENDNLAQKMLTPN